MRSPTDVAVSPARSSRSSTRSRAARAVKTRPASASRSALRAASAVSETAYELGAVLGTAVLGGIITAFYRAAIVLPAGLPTETADAARETLAGAYTASNELSGTLGDELWQAAADAFGSGVFITSLIGAGLVVVAGVIAAVTLRTRTPR